MSYNLTTMQSIYYNQDEIVEITYNNSIVYQKSGPIDYTYVPFFIENTTNADETITLKSLGNGVVSTWQKSSDGTTWENLATMPDDVTFTLAAHTRMYLKCSAGNPDQNNGTRIYGMDTIGGNFATLCGGNAEPTMTYGCLQRYFLNANDNSTADANPNTTLVDARNLVTDYVSDPRQHDTFNRFFYNCTALVWAPSVMRLPVVNGNIDGSQTFVRTFQKCSSLIYPPELPSTVICYSCYWHAFDGCTSLVQAPVIPDCTHGAGDNSEHFQYMFNDCTSLNYIKCLANPSNFGSNSFEGWTTNVAATGTFVKKAGTTWSTGTSGIPSGWTVLEATE